MTAVAGGDRLSTARLLLRPSGRADLDAIVRLANDLEVARNLERMPHPYGPEDARYFLERIVPHERVWAITLAATGELAGIVGLTPRPACAAAELGYWLGRRYWGRGIATEAAAAVADHGLHRLGLAALTSACFTDNPASARVLAKLGFGAVGSGERPCLALGASRAAVALRRMRDRPHVTSARTAAPRRRAPA